SGELINFTAQNINNSYAQLSWMTTSETNTAYFDVERSTDTTNFQSIGQVQAQGSSANPHQYAFKDGHPFGGVNYYQLKQVNADSSFSYSKIVSATFNFSNITIFPNPSTGIIYIQNNPNFSNNQPLNIEIINSLGQVLLRQTGALGNMITLDLAPDIKNDVYIVKVINAGGQVQAKKIFVSR
ncbi:MAG TPA: T9SS type A sorting domain-containing protein, partial [Puia sp.]|nr:T9SS type A sorting domain-containing protein [Puia sp.]